MSFLTGLKSWFSRSQYQPYEELLSELKKIEKNIPDLLDNINTDVGRYNFRKNLEKIKANIELYNERFVKINNNSYLKNLILTRNREVANSFFQKSQNFIYYFRKIQEILKHEIISNEDKENIKRILEKIGSDVVQLNIIVKDAEAILKPMPFNKNRAVDPFKLQGNTSDDVSKSALVKMAFGFGFIVEERKKASSHVYFVNFQDGSQPCAIADSTSYKMHVRNRFAMAVNRTPEELDAVLKSL